MQSHRTHVRDTSTSSKDTFTSILTTSSGNEGSGPRHIVAHGITFNLPPKPLRVKDDTAKRSSRHGNASDAPANPKPRQLKKAYPQRSRDILSPAWQPVDNRSGQRTSNTHPDRFSKELPPTPNDRRLSRPILPALEIGEGKLDMPPALLSPCPSYQTNESGGWRCDLIELDPPTLPDKRPEIDHTAVAKPSSPLGNLVQSGRVSASDARRMTQLWISMLTDKNGNLSTSISDAGSSCSFSSSSIPSTSSVPASRSPNLLAVPSRAVSPAASSDCCDPQLHNTTDSAAPLTGMAVSQSATKRSSDASFVTCTSAAPRTFAVPRSIARKERASLNPYEAQCIETFGGCVAPSASTSDVLHTITPTCPPASIPPVTEPSLKLPGPKRSHSVPQRSTKPVVAASASVPKLERQPIRKAGWPVSAGASYHNRFQRQCHSVSSTISSTSSADAPALLHSPLDMASDSNITPRLRQSSLTSFASQTSVAPGDLKSSVASADSIDSFPSSVSSSISTDSARAWTQADLGYPYVLDTQLSTLKSFCGERIDCLEDAEARDDTVRLCIQPRPVSKLVMASERRSSRRHSTLDIVMYGVAL